MHTAAGAVSAGGGAPPARDRGSTGPSGREVARGHLVIL